MRVTGKYSLAALAAAVLLASCSSGGGSHASSSGVLPAAGSVAASGAQFTVSVARQQSQSANRQTAAISAGIASLVITASGAATASTTINIGATATGCTATATLITCIGTLNLVPGTYAFAVKEYAGANGSGTVLGTGSLSQTLAAGALTNITLTLNGIVNSIQLALNPTTLPSGSAATATLTVMAMDPSGNVIVGPGNYIDANGNPVTISVTTTGGTGVTLGASQATSPANAAITVNYTGASVSAGTQALFHATATAGITAAQAVALTFAGAGSSAGSLYVVTSNFLSQLTADGNTIVTRLPGQAGTSAIGYDAAGNLYVIGYFGFFEYTAGTGTTGTPKRIVSGPLVPGTLLQGGGPPFVDGTGTVYTALASQGYDALGAYSVSASGNVGPDKVWQLSDLVSNIQAVASDHTGNVYVASYDNCCGTRIDVIPSTSPNGAVSSARTISLTGSTGSIGGLGVDAANNLYFYDTGINTVFVVPAGTASGPYAATTFNDPNSTNYVSMTVESSGAVDVGFQSPNVHIDHFSASSSGTVTPPAILQSVTSFSYPASLATTGTGLSVLDNNSRAPTVFAYSATSVASGGSIPATQSFAAVPSGVGAPSSVTVAANGDVVVAGSQGPDAVDIYPAGTLALGTPVRAISSNAIEEPAAAFEDSSGYIYVLPAGPGGITSEKVARRAQAQSKTKAHATRVVRRPSAFFLDQNQLAVFAPGASGNAVPVRTITAPVPYITAATVSANGTVYLVGPAQVLLYAPGTSTPLLTIPYPGTTTAFSIAVDSAGWIYISDGLTIYTIAPNTSTVKGSFLITSPGSGNTVLLANGANLYVSVDAGLESYPLSALRLLGLNAATPVLNSGVIPVFDPTISNPYIFTAVFGP